MSIAGIKINQAFNNSSLSVGGSLAEALLADTNLANWFQADTRSAVLEGSNIVSLLDRKGTIAAFTRAAAGNSAALVEGLFGNYQGAKFNSAESDRSIFSGPVRNLALPFTWSGIARLNSNVASANLMGTFSTSSVRCILNVSAGTSAIRLQYGTSSTAALPIVVGEAFAFSAGFDGTNIFLMINGVKSVVAAAGAPSVSAFALGALPGGSQFWDGDLADIFICDVALNSLSPEATALLAKIRNYTQTAYGLST